MGSAIGTKSKQGSRTGRCGWITSFLRSNWRGLHGDRVQSHVSGERPEMAAHLWSTGYSARSLLNPVSTVPRDWKGGGGNGLVEHAVGS